MSVSVEIDLFSGRRNPCWQLTDADAEQLDVWLHQRTNTAAVSPPALGYRGFVIGREPRLRIYAEPALERWLLASAALSIEPSICNVVLQAIEKLASAGK